MKYYFFLKAGEISGTDNLKKLHQTYKNIKDDFNVLFNSFINENRKNIQLVNQIYIDNVTSNIRQIIYSFDQFKKAKEHFPDEKNNAGYLILDVETASILTFFFNAKSFLEIVRNYSSFQQTKNFKELLADVTQIRTYLAHSYKKDTYLRLYPEAVVVPVIQRGLELELFDILDLRTRIPLGSLYFSIEAFYFEIKNVFKQIKEKPNLLHGVDPILKQGKWINIIGNEVFAQMTILVTNKKEFLEITKQYNEKKINQSLFLFIKRNYVTHMSMTIRRLVDTHPQAVSLISLLNDLLINSEAITIKWFLDEFPDGKDGSLFKEFFNGNNKLNKKVILQDIDFLIKATEAISKRSDKWEAHWDKDRKKLEYNPTFDDLHKAVDDVISIYEKYYYLLTQSSISFALN